jgi:hypothetical protein
VKVFFALWLLLIQTFIFTSSCASEQVSHPSFSFSMRGNLDQESLSCTGSAILTPLTNSYQQPCFQWSISDERCKGSKDADWLHQDSKIGTICKISGEWALTHSLPGRGSCIPKVTFDARHNVNRIILDCEWRCRSSDFPCVGSATYRFEPKKSQVMK